MAGVRGTHPVSKTDRLPDPPNASCAMFRFPSNETYNTWYESYGSLMKQCDVVAESFDGRTQPSAHRCDAGRCDWRGANCSTRQGLPMFTCIVAAALA